MPTLAFSPIDVSCFVSDLLVQTPAVQSTGLLLPNSLPLASAFYPQA
eukprot:CAMPEP_0202808842 /NCGR_PEP_ID=MMETSP1389-20130828/1286_1 /ASSEMBLY_ACC=CAM_ASM_000865 /TAXON_ID=302021 /ORGANISM="Rhodomonas sp., Strain CCMP768" /LENGTH=46 /DNA_ID= /DNA_START= /DNA_END= /DNA_ORIENTATION=